MYGPIVCHLRQLSGMIIPEIEPTFHDSKHGSKSSILRQRGTQIQLHGQRSSMLALIAMGVTFTLCLQPYLYLYTSSVSQFSVPPWVVWLAYIMFILQTNSNPFLYAWRIPEIRELCFKFRRMESKNMISRGKPITNFFVVKKDVFIRMPTFSKIEKKRDIILKNTAHPKIFGNPF